MPNKKKPTKKPTKAKARRPSVDWGTTRSERPATKRKTATKKKKKQSLSGGRIKRKAPPGGNFSKNRKRPRPRFN